MTQTGKGHIQMTTEPKDPESFAMSLSGILQAGPEL